jgi:type I restriction enzyme S subunit
MNNEWPRVTLGEILQRVERFEPRDELTEYPFAGTYSFARGIFVGERKLGSTFALPKIQRIHAGDFIYCKIMAWEGAFGIAPKEADNCVMSSAFVVYELDREKIDEKFLDYFFKVPDHWQSIGRQSTGTNVRRQSLHPSQFERAEIPLPSLTEQRRVVARIEELAAQIHEARTLRHQATEEADTLLSRTTSYLLDDSGWETTLLGEILAESPRNGLSPQQPVEEGGRGMLRINAVSSTPTRFVDMTAFKRVNLTDEVAEQFIVRNEDVFIVRYNGDINRVAKPAIYKGANKSRIVYPDKLMRLRPDRTKMAPDFLVFALNARSVREQIEELGKTTAGNIGISGRNAKSFRVPIPPLPEQRRIVAELDALQAEMDALKRLQSETSAELDALLPSILDKALKGEL